MCVSLRAASRQRASRRPSCAHRAVHQQRLYDMHVHIADRKTCCNGNSSTTLRPWVPKCMQEPSGGCVASCDALWLHAAGCMCVLVGVCGWCGLLPQKNTAQDARSGDATAPGVATGVFAAAVWAAGASGVCCDRFHCARGCDRFHCASQPPGSDPHDAVWCSSNPGHRRSCTGRTNRGGGRIARAPRRCYGPRKRSQTERHLASPL